MNITSEDFPFNLAFSTDAFMNENRKAVLSFDLDNVLNIVCDARKENLRSYLNPWLMLRDDRSELFSILHHSSIYRRFQIAVITNREMTPKMRESTLEWLDVKQFDSNDAFAIFMRPKGVDHKIGLRLKAATVKELKPTMHVDDNAEVLRNSLLDEIPMKIHYNSSKDLPEVEFFLLSILRALESS